VFSLSHLYALHTHTRMLTLHVGTRIGAWVDRQLEAVSAAPQGWISLVPVPPPPA
jgi:hypothetical protein